MILVIVSLFINAYWVTDLGKEIILRPNKAFSDQKSNFNKYIINNDILNFQKLLKIKTISKRLNKDKNTKFEFLKFKQYLKSNYPNILSNIVLTKGYSYLVKIKGRNNKLKPNLFITHYDVVDIENIKKWKHPPFSGMLVDSYIWGRGAVDNKASVFSALEVVKYIIANKLTMQRDLFLIFAHDEEIGGEEGARLFAKYFKNLDLKFNYIIDEGGLITSAKSLGVNENVAYVGLEEKGYIDLLLRLQLVGGHSSMPPVENSLELMSRAITEYKNSSSSTSLNETSKEMFESAANYVPWYKKLVYKNIWIFEPILKKILNAKDQTRPMIQTTYSFTTFNSGIQRNVVPTDSVVNMNLRLHTGDSVKKALLRVRKFFNKYNIKVILRDDSVAFNPTSKTNKSPKSFQIIKAAIKATNKSIKVLPLYVMGATDSRYFSEMGPIFRFVNITLTPKGLKSIHGVNEKISLYDLRLIQMYYFNLLMYSQG